MAHFRSQIAAEIATRLTGLTHAAVAPFDSVDQEASEQELPSAQFTVGDEEITTSYKEDDAAQVAIRRELTIEIRLFTRRVGGSSAAEVLADMLADVEQRMASPWGSLDFDLVSLDPSDYEREGRRPMKSARLEYRLVYRTLKIDPGQLSS